MSVQWFKRGDRVRVTLEGEITRIMDVEPGSEEVELRIEHNGSTSFVYTDMATVEKIEPEYEVFGPGSMLRSTVLPNMHYFLSDGHFYAHNTEYPGGSLRKEYGDRRFTAEFYERVS